MEVCSEEKIAELYQKRIDQQAWMHEHDEQLMGGTRPRCAPQVSERRGIERMFKTYWQCWEKITGWDYPESLKQEVHALILEIYNQEQPTKAPAYVSTTTARKDIMDNYLQDEFVEQLNSTHPIRSFEAFSLYTAIRAVVELVSAYQDGIESLRNIHPTDLPVPNREHILAFKDTEYYDELCRNPGAYVAHALTNIPYLWEAAQTIQLRYGAFVNAVNCEPQQMPDDIRLEMAIQAYLAEEGSADDLAVQYGFGQKRFRRELKDRDILIAHGGYRNRKGA